LESMRWSIREKAAQRKTPPFYGGALMSGSPARTRTANLVVNSHPLCLLSYRGMSEGSQQTRIMRGCRASMDTLERAARQVTAFTAPAFSSQVFFGPETWFLDAPDNLHYPISLF
jgi:hypothetical protein